MPVDKHEQKAFQIKVSGRLNGNVYAVHDLLTRYLHQSIKLVNTRKLALTT